MSADKMIVVLTYILAITPLVYLLFKARRKVSTLQMIGLGAGLPIALSVSLSAFARSYSDIGTIDNRPIENATDGYVSSSACRSCHPGEYDSWHKSYHRTMTQVASPQSILAPFDDVTLDLHGRKYELSRSGDEFFVTMDNPQIHGLVGEDKRVKRKVELTTGSHHLQVYWLETGEGRKLAQLPFGFVVAEKRWIPDHASFVRPPWPEDQQLPVCGPAQWDTGCIRCHATAGKPRLSVAGLPYPDTHVAEFGIACEACHGPGEEHIRVNRDPRRRYSFRDHHDGDPTITNPGRLDSKLSSQVCGQCHSVHTDRSIAAAYQWQNDGSKYVPGDDLFAERNVIRGYEDVEHEVTSKYLQDDSQFLSGQFWSDGMVRVTGREFSAMIETGCYIKGEMSCMTCHSMHKPSNDPRAMLEWADDQLKPGMRGNDACLPCHSDIGADIAAHTHHEINSSGSLCYNCHMPHTTYGLHKAIRSHHIDSPDVTTSIQTGRPNACNQCHLDKTLEWAADYLDTWYGIDPPKLTEDQQSIAASVLWSFEGNAAQRALMAWSYGWQVALDVSGDWWMNPMLMQFMLDPYEAVRFIAYRSLKKREAFSDIDYDFVGPVQQRHAAIAEISKRFRYAQSLRADQGSAGEAVLIKPDGSFDEQIFKRLMSQRDHTPIQLRE